MIIPPAPPGQRGKPDPRQLQDAAANAGLVLPDAAMLAFQQGRMIEAIKLIRAANPGLDLARAKAAMERMQAQAHSAAGEAGKGPAGTGKHAMPSPSRRTPTVEMGDRPGQLRWLLLVVALAAAATWIFYAGGS
ncbi:hypothetical protein [Thermomonas sp.]|uniref:hypothetical protein n=1 Tax=Thermomonas sp. TaxID=1971895 RepID=UPI00378367FD